MTSRCHAAALLAMMGLAAIGAGDDPKPSAQPADVPIADRLARIKSEYAAEMVALRTAVEKAKDQRETNAIYAKIGPDEVSYCRRMIALAEISPSDPAARDALIWVLGKGSLRDAGAYGDEFGRAASLLVRHHGDDPVAIAACIGMSNQLNSRRDALLLGLYASAKSRDSQGLARLALAQYLARKAEFSEAMRKTQGRLKVTRANVIGDDGLPHDLISEQTDEQYAYTISLRLSDPVAIRAEAERLYYEVIEQYADVPNIKPRQRELAALLKEPVPIRNGKPLTEEDRRKFEAIVAEKFTIGQFAQDRLDDLHNLAVGRPAPEIDGFDFDGMPLKLSDYRGKVVALVFWGSWCGPCMLEVPHERELVERLKDRPFAILGVDCNETKAAGLKTIQAEQINWRNWHDGAENQGPIVTRYHIRGWPTVFVIDGKGIIRAKNARGPGLDRLIDELLAELDTKESPK